MRGIIRASHSAWPPLALLVLLVASCNASIEEDDGRTLSYPKLRVDVPPQCVACARLVDNLDNALLPRLRERHAQLQRHHSRTRRAASATVGDLEDIVEAEVERICSWPRTMSARLPAPLDPPSLYTIR